jgi:hypothetical protein
MHFIIVSIKQSQYLKPKYLFRAITERSGPIFIAIAMHLLCIFYKNKLPALKVAPVVENRCMVTQREPVVSQVPRSLS